MNATTPVTAGTRFYYTGDMANASDFGTITNVITDKWGTFFEATLDDGREKIRVPMSMLGHKYEGHCGTRFVTLAAYEAYQVEARAKLQAWSSRVAVR